MENFSKQILRLGAMKGFRHVSFYLRGREELLVVVRSPAGDTGGAASAERTVFLLAGYELYQRPYVWLRSASPVLSLSESAEDMPLPLETTERWVHADPYVTIWEIVAELVSLCVAPAPKNPFEIALETLEGAWAGLPPTSSGGESLLTAAGLELTDLERALNYGAVAGLLHEIFLSDAPYASHGKQAPTPDAAGAVRSTPLLSEQIGLLQQNLTPVCVGAVADDMKRCTERHFEGMAGLLA